MNPGQHPFHWNPIRVSLRAFAALFILVTAHAALRGMAAGAPKPPNIVFILTDDQQYHALGSMGNSLIKTPNLDRLAKRGVIFERCYVTTPICMASRASILTGLHEYRTGCNFTTGKVSADTWNEFAYPVLLRKAGYRLGLSGKWNIPVAGIKHQEAFDEWGGFEESAGQGFYETAKNSTLKQYAKEYPHVSRATAAFGCDFIKNSVKDGRSFYLSLGFKAPHIPYDYIDPLDEGLYADTVFSEPGNYGTAASDKLPIQARLSRQYARRDAWNKENYQKNMRRYYQLVSGMDAAVGMIVAELERQGVADNTVIIFSSDNGHFNGDHGLDDKVLPYEESSRVPTFVVDPRLPAANQNQRSRSIVANIDIGPTILDYAGIKAPENVDGKSLKPLVQDPSREIRKSLPVASTWTWSDTDHSRSLTVITPRWTYTYWAYGDANLAPAEELFDLQNDPLQLQNVVGASAGAKALKEMRKYYDGHLKDWARDTVPAHNYSRLPAIFDRNIPWLQKKFVHYSTTPLKVPYYDTGRKTMIQLYQELVGKPAPTAPP